MAELADPRPPAGVLADSAAEQVSGADLVIRSPSLRAGADFRCRVPLHATVNDIKLQLCREHPEHPQPAEQRLIFAGKLLSDEKIAADVLR